MSDTECLENVSMVVSQDTLVQQVMQNFDDKIQEKEKEENISKYEGKIQKIRNKIQVLSSLGARKTTRKIEAEILDLVEKLRELEEVLEKVNNGESVAEHEDEEHTFGDIFDPESINPSHFIRHGDLTPFELKNREKEEKNKIDDPDFVIKDELLDEEEEEELFETNDNFEDDMSKPSTSAKKCSLPKKICRDDGNLKLFEKRIREWKTERLQKNYKKEEEFTEICDGLKIPNEIWSHLYKYQKTGVRWLWELHGQRVGGILGDEMGLGKTIQVIAFLAGLHYSKIRVSGPNTPFCTLIVCPATVLLQWVQELHRWWPPLRVAILHQSGSHRGKKGRLVTQIAENGGVLLTSYATMNIERDLLLKHRWSYAILDEGHKIRNPDAQMTLSVKRFSTPHRLILTGSPMQNSLKELWSLFDFVYPGRLGTLPVFLQEFSVPITQGGYANATNVQVETAFKCACVLRNTISPYLLRRVKKDVQMTIQLPDKSEQVLFCRITEHQRSLYKEYLCSRECDKIVNGKMDAFVGLILLRKLCNHPDLVTGGPNRLGDLDVEKDVSAGYGHFGRSGKMLVVKSLLKLWKEQNHKVLLFSQSRQMLKILEIFMKEDGYQFLRMDGGTNIGSRQNLVQKFNEEPEIFVFLLTTRVGGLGINLTGADRVIIFDPDWNPSTDLQDNIQDCKVTLYINKNIRLGNSTRLELIFMHLLCLVAAYDILFDLARERAWRIGQERPVTIYRLITAGTIEEKIYHRQIFKQFLTNRVLNDPRQRRFFKTNDLYELFTLSDEPKLEEKDKKIKTETAALFAGTGSEVKLRKLDSRERKRKAEQSVNYFDTLRQKASDGASEVSDGQLLHSVDEEHVDFVPKLDAQTTERLRLIAKQLSKALTQQKITGKVREGHEKKRRKDAKFDGISIPYLKKQTVVKGSDTPDLKEMNKHQDDYVLAQLFKKSGVHSALRHDKIEKCGSSLDGTVEAEAQKVAARAAKALAESRKLCRRMGSGVAQPTWTGAHGNVGRKATVHGSMKPRFGSITTTSTPAAKECFPPKKKGKSKTEDKEEQLRNAMFSGEHIIRATRRDTVEKVKEKKPDLVIPEALDAPTSSSVLLQAMYARKMDSEASSSDEEGVEREATTIQPNAPIVEETHRKHVQGNEHEKVAEDVCTFLKDVGTPVTTEQVVNQFRDTVANEHLLIFKHILQKMCQFERNDQGIGLWKLKNEYL